MMDGMTDPGPPGPGLEQIRAALDRAVSGFTEGFGQLLDALARLAEDPRVRGALAAERPVGRPCHCLCRTVHAADPGICDGAAASMVTVGGLEVPMCAPCQAARAAERLAGQG
jgi:hypothetical protein